ncbi:MAG: GNAT family N-acetyltransferase [Phenylobacterium sp.]|nr:MAG: GNAT family N-acetyltransferase [Phenylobacterium sp.]
MSAAGMRPASAEDAPAIRELTRAAYAKWVPLIGREPKPMTADYEAAVRRHRFDLIHDEGVLVGLIETIEEPDQLLIENVAVAPAFQGRGLGRRLMAQAEAVAHAAGYDRIRLYTNQRFTDNIALYLRLGYGVDGETQVHGGVRVDMSKRLGEPARRV